MATSTVENYVKHIFLIEEDGKHVPMGVVAHAVGVAPGTATSMMKTLDDAGLVDYAPRVGVRLTPQGRKLALRVLRRARIIEYFLVETLGLDWTEINAEAEEMEHVISDRVLDALDAFLGHPKTDPHGDPIPSAEGTLIKRNLKPLTECDTHTPVTIARITDQEAAFLQYLEQSGLTPGVSLRITKNIPAAGAIELDIEHRGTLTLGASAADKILVE